MASDPTEISLEEFMKGEIVEPDTRFGEDVSDVTVPLGNYSLEQTKNILALQRKAQKKKKPSLVDEFNNQIEAQGGWGLSGETRRTLGGDGPVEALRPLTDLPANIADLGYRGLQALQAGTNVGLEKLDEASQASGLSDLLSVGGEKFRPGTLLGGVMEALPLGGIESGMTFGKFLTPKGDTLTPEVRAQLNDEATQLFNAGATAPEMQAWAKSKGLAPFGDDLEQAIANRPLVEKPEGLSATEVVAAQKQLKSLEQEAAAFKGTTNPNPEEVFKKELTAEEWAAGLNAPEGKPSVSEPAAPEPYIQELSPPSVVNTLEEDIKFLESKGLARSHFASDEELQQVAGKIRGREAVEPVSYEGPVSSDLPEAEVTLNKKQAKAAFEEELAAKPKQTASEWKKNLEESAKAFLGDKEPETPTTFSKPEPEVVVQAEETLPTEDVVTRLTNALNEAGKALPEQAAARSQVRKERLAAARRAMQEEGFAGLHKAKAALSGELPKADFESVADRFTPEDVKELTDSIKQSPNLRGFEPINALSGLEKLMKGELPTPNEVTLLGKVFPPEFVKATLKNRKTSAKMMHNAANLLNLPRAIMSSFDLSAPLRQGLFLVGRQEFWKNWSTMFKAARSDESFKAMMDEIRDRPSYSLMEESNLAIAETGYDLSKREEDFISQWAEKIPGVKMSERAYTGFLNKLRADTFDSLLRDSKALGIDVDNNPQAVKDISNFVNSATGRGDLGKFNQSAPILNALFFSPRLIASRLDLLVPVRYVNPKVNPAVRKAYIKSLLSLGSIALTVTALAKAGGAKVESDPRSSDFAKIKTGNTRYDILGGFGQYITLGARLLTNETKTIKGEVKTLGEGYGTDTRKDVVERFAENKFAPVPGYVRDALQGSDPVGQPFEPAGDAAELFVPLFWQDVNEMRKEYGTLEGALRAAPGIFGIGVSNYAPTPSKEEFMQGEIVETPDAPEEISLEEFMKGEIVE